VEIVGTDVPRPCATFSASRSGHRRLSVINPRETSSGEYSSEPSGHHCWQNAAQEPPNSTGISISTVIA